MELKTFGKLQHLGGIKYKKVMVIYENRNFKKEGTGAQNLEKREKISRYDLSMNKERETYLRPHSTYQSLGRSFMNN